MVKADETCGHNSVTLKVSELKNTFAMFENGQSELTVDELVPALKHMGFTQTTQVSAYKYVHGLLLCIVIDVIVGSYMGCPGVVRLV